MTGLLTHEKNKFQSSIVWRAVEVEGGGGGWTGGWRVEGGGAL